MRSTRLATVISIVALVIAIGGAALMAQAGGGGSDTGRVVGFAYVKEDGDVRSKLSLNVRNSNVRAVASNQFCFKNLPFSFKGAQVTIDTAEANDLDSTAHFTKSVYGNCADNEPAVVETGSSAQEPFYIVFYK